MKKNLILALILIALPAVAGEQITAGPRHGRILKLDDSKAEFLVEKDRTVSIAFYDAAQKERAPGEQVVSVIAEAPGGKKKIDFERKGQLLVSKEPLPEGEDYQVVVQIKETSEAKPKNFRIKLDLSICQECKNAEYACICGH